jgi:hypothetical protein
MLMTHKLAIITLEIQMELWYYYHIPLLQSLGMEMLDYILAIVDFAGMAMLMLLIAIPP